MAFFNAFSLSTNFNIMISIDEYFAFQLNFILIGISYFSEHIKTSISICLCFLHHQYLGLCFISWRKNFLRLHHRPWTVFGFTGPPRPVSKAKIRRVRCWASEGWRLQLEWRMICRRWKRSGQFKFVSLWNVQHSDFQLHKKTKRQG